MIDSTLWITYVHVPNLNPGSHPLQGRPLTTSHYLVRKTFNYLHRVSIQQYTWGKHFSFHFSQILKINIRNRMDSKLYSWKFKIFTQWNWGRKYLMESFHTTYLHNESPKTQARTPNLKTTNSKICWNNYFKEQIYLSVSICHIIQKYSWHLSYWGFVVLFSNHI